MLHIDMSGTSWLCVTTHVRGPLISLGVGEDVLQEDIGGPPRRPGGLFVVRELGLLVDGLCRVGEGVEGVAAKHLQLPLHAGVLELRHASNRSDRRLVLSSHYYLAHGDGRGLSFLQWHELEYDAAGWPRLGARHVPKLRL